MDGELDIFKDAKSLWTRLWREIYGEPPPLADDPQLLSRILVESLPPLPPYELGRKVETRPSDPTRPPTASRADPSD
jgi:hypothetical protein